MATWFIVGRCWSFGNGAADFARALNLVRRLVCAQRCETYAKVFDGRRLVAHRLDADDSAEILLPRQFSWVGARLSRSAKSIPDRSCPPSHFVINLKVSPVSLLWARPTRRASKHHEDRQMAMTCRSYRSYVRHHALRHLPHLIEFFVEKHSKWPHDDRAKHAARDLAIALKQLGSGGLVGGIDFVRNFVEMGSAGLEDLSSVPATWRELRSRFDEMHKIMFGPERYFAPLTPAAKHKAFEQFKAVRIRNSRYVVAVARTDARQLREFAYKPTSILADRSGL